jgi:hypothetical protein
LQISAAITAPATKKWGQKRSAAPVKIILESSIDHKLILFHTLKRSCLPIVTAKIGGSDGSPGASPFGSWTSLALRECQRGFLQEASFGMA